jgi:hypothetical protein
MTEARCPICRSDRERAFTGTVLGRHAADYLKCRNCGFLGVDRPSWLEEAYASPIASVDTGILERCYQLRPRLVSLLRMACPPGSVFADVGAGYGVLVRAMRDAGLDFRWSDPFCTNLLARGFELGTERCAAVTAIEVLEHTLDPLAFLEETLARTGAAVAVVTTEPLPSPVPDPSWWYYSPASGQHISFFEVRTLAVMARRLGLRLHTRHSFHVLHDGTVTARQFLVASTRLARVAAPILRRSMPSLSASDSLLVEGTTTIP